VKLLGDGPLGILATEGTCKSEAYPRRAKGLRPGVKVFQSPCPDFVPLVEDGKTDTPETRDAAHRYLRPLLAEGCRTIILGDALVTAAVDGAAATNGFVEEPTAQPLRGAPPPGSLADRDAKAALSSEDGEGKAEANVVLPTDGREGGA
jgi:hypothetical protein